MPGRRERMRTGGAALVGLLMFVAACSPQATDNDAAGLQLEYQRELAHLAFPPGFQPADGPPGAKPDERYEPGFGVSSADFQWLCAWFDEYQSNRLTVQANSNRALAVLSTFPNLALWDHMDPTGRAKIMDAVEAAMAGDPSGISAQQAAMACAE